MDEPGLSQERLAGLLEAVRGDVAYPPTPSISQPVTARLLAQRAAGIRPPLAGLALWSRRKVLVLVAVGVLAALAVAAAARLAIGAIEIRVQPGMTPAPYVPPVEPDRLGEATGLEAAQEEAGFAIALPQGPPPDEVHLVQSPLGEPGIVVAWQPGPTYPTIPGTKWSLVLMAFPADARIGLKTVGGYGDVHRVTVGGRRAFWIPEPHEIFFETEAGPRGPYQVQGNILIWEAAGGITYRLETSLGRAEAIALAGSI